MRYENYEECKKFKLGEKLLKRLSIFLMIYLVTIGVMAKEPVLATTTYEAYVYSPMENFENYQPIIKVKLKKSKVTFYGKVYKVKSGSYKASKGSKKNFKISSKCKYYEYCPGKTRLSKKDGRAYLKGMGGPVIEFKVKKGKVVEVIFRA